MKRFRLQNNVPDVYVKQSRDFQLMCNLFDIINNGIKFDIDTITDLSDTTLCRESMLPYLQSKLGLELSKEIPSDTLRIILKCFPYIVNNKGCRRGVEEAICLFLNIIYANCKHSIDIQNISSDTNISGNYLISIELEDNNALKNLHILDDILKYVIPSGYILRYDLKYSVEDLRTEIYPLDSINITFVSESYGSKPRKTEAEDIKDEEDNIIEKRKVYKDEGKIPPGVIGAVGTTIITAVKEDSADTRKAVDSVINSSDNHSTGKYVKKEIKNPHE